jgi:Putative Flp pilus-assembly TadE/G-like
MKIVRRLPTKSESAQAMIMFAILLPIIMSLTGLAVEGGRIFVEYRRLQSAADMAALVGAQDLPCGTADTTCIQKAETDACSYATLNGLAGCAVGDRSSSMSANVPPVSCSPYSGLDYGTDNNAGNTYSDASCKASSGGVPSYSYVEVRLTDNLGTVPFFNKPVTLITHAVARFGVPSHKDFAISVLDTASGALTLGGSLTLFVNGATFSNGSISTNGSQTFTACDGGWFTAANQTSAPADLATDVGGTPAFATASGAACEKYTGGSWQAISPPGSPSWGGNLAPITDPYCNSVTPPFDSATDTYGVAAGTYCNRAAVPPASDSSAVPASDYTSVYGAGISAAPKTIPNCPDCNNWGYYHDSSGWHQATAKIDPGSASGTTELFPGIYENLFPPGGGKFVLNPGVYTVLGGMDQSHGDFCIFGAPACDLNVPGGVSGTTCQNDNFVPNGGAGDPSNSAPYNTNGDTWYYNCSPWGIWDSMLTRPSSGLPNATGNVAGCLSAQGPCTAAPTWWDTSTGAPSTKPLNGVTIYFAPGSSGITQHGAGSAPQSTELAFPNPCPGTGTVNYATSPPTLTGGTGFKNAVTASMVQFNPGSASAFYAYQPGSLAYTNGFRFTTSDNTASGTPFSVYPSFDLTQTGECKNTATANTYQVWPGEVTPGEHLHFLFFSREANGGSGKFNFELNGNNAQNWFGTFYTPFALENVKGAGKGVGGPPWITGQIVSWDIDFSGNGSVDLIYRPCGESEVSCASGVGTALIE